MMMMIMVRLVQQGMCLQVQRLRTGSPAALLQRPPCSVMNCRTSSVCEPDLMVNQSIKIFNN